MSHHAVTYSSIRAYLLALALLLGGCAWLPLSIGGNQPPRPARLRITSSPALLPLVTTAAALFERQHPEAQIIVQSGESLDGLSALIHQQTDIAAAARYADPSTASAATLRDQLVCAVPFLVVAHPNVPLVSLSRQQLLRIFSTGTLTNWKQIGGPDQQVMVVLPPLTADIRLLFREEVLGSAADVGDSLPTASLETLRDTVARTPGSISYLPGALLNARVRQIAIDGQAATPEHITSGRYPFWSFAHLYTRDSAAPGEDREMRTAFLRFMQSSQVEQLIRQLGCIPLSEMNVLPALSAETPSASA